MYCVSITHADAPIRTQTPTHAHIPTRDLSVPHARRTVSCPAQRERARARRHDAVCAGPHGCLGMAGFRRVVPHALRCSMLGSTAFHHRAAAQRDGGRLTANATPPTAAATISPILRSPALSSARRQATRPSAVPLRPSSVGTPCCVMGASNGFSRARFRLPLRGAAGLKAGMAEAAGLRPVGCDRAGWCMMCVAAGACMCWRWAASECAQ